MSAGLKKFAAGWHVNLVLLPQETWQTHKVKLSKHGDMYLPTYFFREKTST
jgi:hypothetical protein